MAQFNELQMVGASPQTLHRSADLDETAQTAKSGASTLREVFVDNSANAEACYLKIWDNLTPTPGTTDPYICLHVAASAKETFVWHGGKSFSNGVKVACLKHVSDSDGPGTSGTTGPDSAVPVEVVTD